MRASRFVLMVLLTLPLGGCAGGWRGGIVPAEWAETPATMPIAAAPRASAATNAKAATAGGTHATSTGAVFVWRGEGGAVNLAGEFNAWSTSADPMLKQADGSWKLEKPLAAGSHAYKFVIDGTTWKPDPSVAEGVDDGFGGKNSIVVVGDAAAAAAPVAKAAAPLAPVTKGAGPAVTAAGVVFTFTGAANTVNLAGEFNSWSTSADALTKNADGTFSITRALPPGRYQYKFVLDGGNWKEDPNAAESTDDGYGGKNSVVVVGDAGGAAAAPVATAVAIPVVTTVRPLAPGAKPVAPQVTAAGVVFTYAGAAKSGVALCGDFNAWATTADRMTQAADGTWKITKQLAPGTHAYKFLVDGGSWKPDDGNTQSKDDGFGGKNSIVVVK